MTRREWWVAALGIGAVARMLAPAPLGVMNVRRWHDEGHYAAGHRVYVDGRDVTNDCYMFTGGWAEVFVRDARGRAQVTPDGRHVQRARLHGRVEVR